MEVPQQAATEESSSQNRTQARKNKQLNSDCTDLLESKSESSLQIPVRRSLRIFAKQKLEEEKQQSSSADNLKQGSEVGIAAGSETTTGSGRKRTRSHSPKSAESPRKQVKSGPSRKRLKGEQSIEKSVSPVSLIKSELKKSSGSKSKEESHRTAGKHSRSEGEESDKVVQKRRKKTYRKQKQSETSGNQSNSDTEASSKSQGKKGKGRYRGKYRGKQGGTKSVRKTGYHSALFKITMASPGNTDPMADSTEGENIEDLASLEEQRFSRLFQGNLRSRHANEAGQLSSGEEPSLEPFLSMDESTRRMHGIPGLPHHLLGALGSRMYMMHKSLSNSMSSSNGECLLLGFS